MKLIAVDPSVIPLGSTVYVEGYGDSNCWQILVVQLKGIELMF